MENMEERQKVRSIRNKEIESALDLVLENGLNLRYVSSKMRDTKNVVLASVENNGLALEYASNRLQNDKEVVSTAMVQNAEAIRFASKRLQRRKDILAYALSENVDLKEAGIDAKITDEIKEEATRIKESKDESSLTTKDKITIYKLSKEMIEAYESGRMTQTAFDAYCEEKSAKRR